MSRRTRSVTCGGTIAGSCRYGSYCRPVAVGAARSAPGEVRSWRTVSLYASPVDTVESTTAASSGLHAERPGRPWVAVGEANSGGLSRRSWIWKRAWNAAVGPGSGNCVGYGRRQRPLRLPVPAGDPRLPVVDVEDVRPDVERLGPGGLADSDGEQGLRLVPDELALAG